MITPTGEHTSYLILPDFQYLWDDRKGKDIQAEETSKKEAESRPKPSFEKETEKAPEENRFTPTPLSGVSPSVWDDEVKFRTYVAPRDELDITADENIEEHLDPARMENLELNTEQEILPSQTSSSKANTDQVEQSDSSDHLDIYA